MNRKDFTRIFEGLRKSLIIASLVCFGTALMAQSTITGKVSDANGALAGVTVAVKGTNTGVLTNSDGVYSVSVPNSNATLVFSLLGFVTQEIALGGRTVIDVNMQEQLEQIDEVVVVGYGTNSKRNLTSSVSTVDVSKMTNLPVASITDALAGRTAGIIVTQSGGGPGQYSSISIRGGGTPIVVIDGFISPYQDFINLNTNDIESMSILKDASSTAVYGARAGDGVLVVKTKGGVKGLRLDYGFNANWSQSTNLPKKLNSYERALLDNTVREMYKLDPLCETDELEKFRTGSDPYNYPDTDWQKVVLKDFAPEYKHSVSLRGGSDVNKFHVSFQAFDQQSLYRENSDWLKRYNVMMNENVELKEIGLRLNLGLNGYITNQRQPNMRRGDVWGHIQMFPTNRAAYNKFGQFTGSAASPAVDAAEDSGYNRTDIKAITGLFNAEWDVYGVKGLKLKFSGNYRVESNNNKVWTKIADTYDLDGNRVTPSTNVSLSYTNRDFREFTMQYFADYKRSFGKDAHNVSATFGYEGNYAFNRVFSAGRKEYVFMIDQMGAGPSGTMENSGSEAEQGRAGFIGRLAYDYKRKYYVEGSLRHDGSDLFPKDRRWGTFFAGSVGYAVSEETFFAPLKEKNILNFLKLRASYGETGLDSGVGRFSYLSSYGLADRGYVVDGKIVPTFSEGALVNENISWYTRNTTNFGIDFSSLNERLSGSIDYFYIKTTGYLTSPSNVGYTDPLGLSLPTVKSNGEHRRAGFEFALAWKDRIGDLHYEVGGNFTWFDQLVAVAWNEDLASQKNPYRRQVQQTGYHSIGYLNSGFYQNSDEVMNSPHRESSSNLVAGDVRYVDANGDGQIDAQDQRRIGKNQMPRGNYGININLRYKGFFANILFQGATSRDIMLYGHLMGHHTAGYTVFYQYQLDYWTPDNRNALFPRIAMNGNVNGNNNLYDISGKDASSDFWLIQGRYFRLKSAQIGYDFREKLLSRLKWIHKLELVLSGQNLFTLSPATKYGIDPETGNVNGEGYPVQRVYALSLNIGF
ncbi:MAG: TonB-dependent receptor [Tannerella sp.]|jgi:TonB-linked SusC/RagA family outer membrane protein|nr:TonB-dependent receptor [Tannerella sp.]